MANIKMMLARAGLKLKKHSPTILTIAGVVGLTTAGVMACVQTKKVDAVIEKHKNRLDDLHDCKEEIVKEVGAPAYRASVIKAYVKTAWDFTKLYGIPLAIAGASVTAILCGHSIISKRHAALSTAYNSLNSAFNTYRNRVREDAGEEKDLEYYTGKRLEKKNNQAYNIDDPIDKEIAEEIASGNTDASEYAIYSRYFDEWSDRWVKDPIVNKATILSVQNWANNILKTRGYVFLNEIYDALGLKRSPVGQLVGWVLTDDGSTSNFIDFGLYSGSDGVRDFMNGHDRNVLLDFNVDGVIYNLI